MFEGRIELIIGPMFSGKSSELQRIVRRFRVANKKCQVINYSKDNRYSKDEVAATHDKLTIPAIKVESLKEAEEIVKDIDVIAIDEGQFFVDLTEYVEKWANNGKIVVVAALDATFERKPFGQVCDLVAKAETVQKLSSVCLQCSSSAYFTMKLDKTSKKVNEIGGIELYHPVCRACYNKCTDYEVLSLA